MAKIMPLGDSITAASPDITLLHIGTNDQHEFQGVQSTVNDIGSIFDRLRTVNPNIRILVAQLITSSNPRHKYIPALNAQLPPLIAVKNRATSPIVLVDQFTGFDPTTMTTDWFSPNAIGGSRVADRWIEKLAPMLDSPAMRRNTIFLLSSLCILHTKPELLHLSSVVVLEYRFLPLGLSVSPLFALFRIDDQEKTKENYGSPPGGLQPLLHERRGTR